MGVGWERDGKGMDGESNGMAGEWNGMEGEWKGDFEVLPENVKSKCENFSKYYLTFFVLYDKLYLNI